MPGVTKTTGIGSTKIQVSDGTKTVSLLVIEGGIEYTNTLLASTPANAIGMPLPLGGKVTVTPPDALTVWAPGTSGATVKAIEWGA